MRNQDFLFKGVDKQKRGELVVGITCKRPASRTLFSKPGIVTILASMGAIQVEVEMAGVQAHLRVMLGQSWPLNTKVRLARSTAVAMTNFE